MNAKLKMILSMAIFGTIPLFVRLIPLTSAEVALFRALIALACLAAAKAALKKPVPIRGAGGDLPLLLLSGAAMGFNWILLFEAYRYTTVSVATLSYYFAPVIVMAASVPLLNERMTPLRLLCFVGSTAGLVLVINAGGLSQGSDPAKGVLFGLGAAALYATVILLNKRIRRYSGLDRTLLQFAAAAVVLAPYVLLTGGIRFGGMTGFSWVYLLAVGAVHTALAYVLYFSSLKALAGQEAAILSYIDPLVAVLLSVAVLGEPATAAQLAGGAMILGFTLLNELRGQR